MLGKIGLGGLCRVATLRLCLLIAALSASGVCCSEQEIIKEVKGYADLDEALQKLEVENALVSAGFALDSCHVKKTFSEKFDQTLSGKASMAIYSIYKGDKAIDSSASVTVGSKGHAEILMSHPGVDCSKQVDSNKWFRVLVDEVKIPACSEGQGPGSCFRSHLEPGGGKFQEIIRGVVTVSEMEIILDDEGIVGPLEASCYSSIGVTDRVAFSLRPNGEINCMDAKLRSSGSGFRPCSSIEADKNRVERCGHVYAPCAEPGDRGFVWGYRGVELGDEAAAKTSEGKCRSVRGERELSNEYVVVNIIETENDITELLYLDGGPLLPAFEDPWREDVLASNIYSWADFAVRRFRHIFWWLPEYLDRVHIEQTVETDQSDCHARWWPTKLIELPIFCRKLAGFVPKGLCGDVIIHELAHELLHALLAKAYPGDTSRRDMDQPLNEGLADYLAVYATNYPVYGRHCGSDTRLIHVGVSSNSSSEPSVSLADLGPSGDEKMVFSGALWELGEEFGDQDLVARLAIFAVLRGGVDGKSFARHFVDLAELFLESGNNKSRSKVEDVCRILLKKRGLCAERCSQIGQGVKMQDHCDNEILPDVYSVDDPLYGVKGRGKTVVAQDQFGLLYEMTSVGRFQKQRNLGLKPGFVVGEGTLALSSKNAWLIDQTGSSKLRGGKLDGLRGIEGWLKTDDTSWVTRDDHDVWQVVSVSAGKLTVDEAASLLNETNKWLTSSGYYFSKRRGKKELFSSRASGRDVLEKGVEIDKESIILETDKLVRKVELPRDRCKEGPWVAGTEVSVATLTCDGLLRIYAWDDLRELSRERLPGVLQNVGTPLVLANVDGGDDDEYVVGPYFQGNLSRDEFGLLARKDEDGSPVRGFWPLAFPTKPTVAPAYADRNEDGCDEVVLGFGREIQVWDPNKGLEGCSPLAVQ